ncbi:LOW QUALITY PROTEIN: hypothetical protein Cgig2_026393 [Carnegiea gigantea]|uniref:DUF4283 domain-containing protein n=1 Tax=Carnegiea gigantea TaxID=171969 RepID=A0A9Q1QBF4_9CARY|nr:LOW QUALITY PROTEIN: hypothetical protein Cgig2_026393 [Carnegiea gigantea]
MKKFKHQQPRASTTRNIWSPNLMKQSHGKNIHPEPSSYASLVDPEEGTDLKFVSAEIIDGRKMAKIVKEDEQTLHLKSCKGLSEEFEGHMRSTGYYKSEKGCLLFNIQDKLIVKKRGTYYFDAKPVVVKGWNPQMDLQTENIKSLTIWVQLLELDIKFWGNESLSKIGSILGIPLKTDRYTKEEMMTKYTRMLIDMPLDGENTIQLMQIEEQHSPSPMEEFTLVAKRNTTKQSHLVANPTTYEHDNPFQALEFPMLIEGRGAPMDNIISWNIGSLNWPNKQEDLKAFLCTHKVGMIGLMETKIKLINDNVVAARTFPGWRWDNNSTPSIKGRL